MQLSTIPFLIAGLFGFVDWLALRAEHRRASHAASGSRFGRGAGCRAAHVLELRQQRDLGADHPRQARRGCIFRLTQGAHGRCLRSGCNAVDGSSTGIQVPHCGCC